MKISDIRATTVTVPLEAPLRHANGCHWGRFVRTVVEVESDEGLIGLGEMGGGGESAEESFRALKRYLVGHDPARLEQMRFLIANPTASLYNNRTQILAALEFACLDILGQKWGVPVSEILGGRLQDRVPFASYLFFRYPNQDGTGEVRTPEQIVAQRVRSKRHTASRRTSSRGASSRRTMTWNVTARSRLRSPATASGSTPTASGRQRRPSGSASRSRISATIIWKTPSSVWRECAGCARRCACRWRPTRSSSTSSSLR